MNNTENKSWRNDAVAKVTGKAKYTDDLKVHNLLYAVPVYTNSVHAKILDINITDAKNYPEVVSIITAKDIPGKNRFGQIHHDCPILADDKILCNGDVIAIVVAENRQAALKASVMVKTELRELPKVFDPSEAIRSEILVHEKHGSNLINHHKIRHGNIINGFNQSDIILEEEFSTSFAEHAYLEPESAVCIPRHDGVMEVYSSMQHPFSTRRFVAAALGVKLSEIEVKTVPIGGGFGGKDDTASIIAARTAIAAKLTGRPVKMTYTREWSIRESYKRHPYKVNYKLGLTKDGRMKAMEVKILADGGAYCSVSPWVTWRSTVQCCGPYVIDNVKCDTYAVYTNNVYTGAFRGFGSPQINFCIEQMIDIAAEKLGISAVELRSKNMVQQNSVTITGQKLTDHTVSLNEVFEKVKKESDYENKYKNCSFGQSIEKEQYGIGLAISYRGMSLGAEGADFNSAIINVQQDGSILLETGIHENGQGSESAMILILAEELGVKKERIRYRQPSTSNIPDGGTTVASRGTLMGGGAVVLAAENLKKKISEVIAPKLGCSPSHICFEDERIFIKSGISSASYSFDEAIKEMYRTQNYPYSFGVFKAPKVSWNEQKGQGNPYFTWVYGCQAVELTVNKETGKVKLLKAYAAHDVGRAVNRSMLQGQFYGGMAMGIGYALYEDLKIKDGRIQSLNLNSYRIPRASDLPEMEAIIIENKDTLSPSSAKGIGEPAMELMAPAIANAIYNATAKRYYKLPIKIEAE